MPDTLETGQSLQPGDRITSNNGNNSFVAQADGNLVIYREPGAVAIWWSNTAGRHLAHATLTDSGAFVAFQDDTTYYWATSTLNKITGPCKMVMHDDGNLIVFDNSPQLLWASMSSMAPPLVNGHYYLIRNLGSGTCLTLEDDPNHFPRSIRGYTVKRSDEQRWYLKLWVDNHNEEENVYILQNKASGYLLTQNMPGPTVKGLLFGWPESQRDIDYQLWTHNREKGFSYRYVAFGALRRRSVACA